MIVLNVLFSILILVLLGILLAGLIIVVRVTYALCHHTCKHCHRVMDYKGLKENDKESHHLFHCPHCGAWEQVNKGDFYKKATGFSNIRDYGKTGDS